MSNCDKRRVVCTGMGIVLPGSYNVKDAFSHIVNGDSFITKIESFDSSEMATKIAGEIKFVSQENLATNFPKSSAFIYENLFDPTTVIEKKDVKKMDKFIMYCMHAAEQAIVDAGLKNSTANPERIGVMVGSGIGGLVTIEETDGTLRDSGPRRVSPFFIPSVLINLLSGQVSIKYGYKGPNFGIVSACSTSAHSIGEGAKAIICDDADVMIVGGSETAICKLGITGFNALRALSTNFNDRPQEASRPWDKDRDGFVMGEGAGILVLEEYEHAKKRGAHIYCEIAGYGASGDAYHLTAPHPDGDGAFLAMKNAIKKAGINPEEIDYINAHGTSTPLGDEIEVRAVKRVLGDKKDITMSSTKSATGHLLGAAGAVEAIFSILAINNGILPPTLNLHNPSDDCDLDFVPKVAKEKKINVAISNSFGFGGCNASVLFKKLS